MMVPQLSKVNLVFFLSSLQETLRESQSWIFMIMLSQVDHYQDYLNDFSVHEVYNDDVSAAKQGRIPYRKSLN